MTSRHHSYSTGEALEPVTFDIDGESFTCHAVLPGTTLTNYMRRFSGDLEEAIQATIDFFGAAMAEEEHVRFRAFVDDPDRNVDINVLMAVFQDLVVEYGGGERPSVPSQGSAPMRRRTGPTSLAVSVGPAKTQTA